LKYRPNPLFRRLRRLAHYVDNRGVRAAILSPFDRFIRYFRTHGLIATLKRLARKAPAPAPTPAEDVIQQPDPFDLLHGTDTGGLIWGKDIPGISLSALYSTAYAGIPPSVLTQALAALPIHCEDFSFVDVGCGKGRALLTAANFSFRRLIGVELSSELCSIACANIALKSDWASRISIVNQDATKISYPDGPLLLYLYNPFRAPILRRFLKNLEGQLRKSPRPVYLLYAWDPDFKRVMESFPFLHQLSITEYPLSPEEARANPFNKTEESFTLYRSDITAEASFTKGQNA
jgi:SAM-dependent methyltransferase